MVWNEATRFPGLRHACADGACRGNKLLAERTLDDSAETDAPPKTTKPDGTASLKTLARKIARIQYCIRP